MLLYLPATMIYIDTDTIGRVELLEADSPESDSPDAVSVILKHAPWVPVYQQVTDPQLQQDVWQPVLDLESPNPRAEQQTDLYEGDDAAVLIAWCECEAGKTRDLLLNRAKSLGKPELARARGLLGDDGDDGVPAVIQPKKRRVK